MNLNKAIIIGRLTRDPELRSLPSGVKVTSFSLATNRVYNDSSGQRQEQTDFHNIVVFGRQAETSAQYLKKGAVAMVEGRIQTRSWEADGEKKYRTEIVADRVQFGPRAGAGGGGGGSHNSQANSPTSNSSDDSNQDTGPEMPTINYPESDINPDDIPF